MSPIRHVLAATDLPAPARHAAERAAALARSLGATLDLVHVAPAPPLERLRRLVGDFPEDLAQRWRADSEAALHALAAALAQRHGLARASTSRAARCSARSHASPTRRRQT